MRRGKARISLCMACSLISLKLFLSISLLRVASGPRVKLIGSKSGSNRPVVYSADRSKAVVPC